MATACGLPMSMWQAAHDRSPIATLVSPSTWACPNSVVIRSPRTRTRLMPDRVAMGIGRSGSARPASTRCRAKTRMPLPHISESDPSLLR